jgi:hypothetical protein
VSPPERRRALVIVRDGPAVERGWLGLRTALALGLGGYEVSVWLEGDAVAFALTGLDVRAWAGADPGADVDGLVEEMGAAIHVDAESLYGAQWDGMPLRKGVHVGILEHLWPLYDAAGVVVAP